MTEQHHDTTPTDRPIPPGQDVVGQYAPAPYGQHGAAPQAYAPGSQAMGPGSLGNIRGTGVCVLLLFVTFGIYSLVWFYKTHDEMKRHSGQGLGGGLALVLAIFVGFAMPYVTSSEVGELYGRSGRSKPVSGATGLWYFPGMLLLVGPIVWFVKTNGALNGYWRSLGAR